MARDKRKRKLSRRKGAKTKRRSRTQAALRESTGLHAQGPGFRELQRTFEQIRSRLDETVRHFRMHDRNKGADHCPKRLKGAFQQLGKRCKTHPWWGKPMRACMRSLLDQIHRCNTKVNYYVRYVFVSLYKYTYV